MVAGKPPYLRRDRRNGTWNYRRTIPPKLRSALGGKREFIRSLGVSTDRFTSREFRRAYAAADAEAEALFRNAERPPLAMTQRDSFGLMREMLLSLEMGTAQPQQRAIAPTVDYQAELQKLQRDLVVTELSDDPQETRLAITHALQLQELMKQRLRSLQAAEVEEQNITAQVLEQTLNRLGLQLTPQQQLEFLAVYEQHKDQLLKKRAQELTDLNFNSVGGVLEQLPEPPRRVTTWETLREAWITRKGGRRSQGGKGLAEGSIHRADKHWSEIQMLTQVANPTDLTTEMVRTWIQWMQKRLVPTTVLSNLKIMKAVFRVGVAEGLLEENVAEHLTVSPEAVEGYVPFEPEEIRLILEATAETEIDYQKWLPRLALFSGARIEEIAQLRRQDVREINGVMCLDFVHRPEDPLPTFLKGKLQSERQVPIHPWIIEQGFIDFCEGREGRLFEGNGEGANTVGPSASRWFRLVLTRLGIWVKRKKVFHSFRSTFKDNCRRAGIAADVHHALTGHAPGNVGDKSYGMTLRKMPEVTIDSVKKLPNPQNL